MNTYGYDYVYALTKDKVNELLAQNLANVDMPLQYTDHDPVTGAVTTIDVTLDPWSMADGGQNSLVKLNVPIKQGFLSISGLPGVDGSWDMTGVTLLIEVNLGWMGPGDVQVLDGEGSETQLVFSPTQSPSSDDPGYVAIISVTDPSGQLSTAAIGMLEQIAQEAFYENRANLQYIFASVVPTPSGAGTWLRPVKWQYYVASGSIEALSFLCMLSDTDFPSTPAFDTSALAPGSNAVALIAEETFFKNALLPAVEASFPDGSFSVSEQNEHSVIANSGSFTVTVDDDNIATDSFTLWPADDGNGLQSSSSGGGPLTFLFGLADLPDATYSWSVKTVNPLDLNITTGVMTFQDDPSPKETHEQDIPWYDYIILVSLGLTLVGLIDDIINAVNGFGDQVNKVGMSNINDCIQSSFGNNVINVANLLDWNVDGESFHLTAGGMSGALYFRGNLSK